MRSTSPSILVVESPGAPAEAVRAVTAALGAHASDVHSVSINRDTFGAGTAARMIQSFLGEEDGRRLERELTAVAPSAVVAFTPGVAAVLIAARDRAGAAAAPVVCVVPELAPRQDWPLDVDRYAVVDDEAAVALAEFGIDGARVVVTGPVVAAGSSKRPRSSSFSR